MLKHFRAINRYKHVNTDFLYHTEFIRKLRTPSLIGIASVLSIPLGLFTIVPYTVMNIAGPSALLSLLLAFIVITLSGFHQNELMCSMPKSCLLYNFLYANCGELPAFLVGWMSLLDYTIMVVIVAKSWSSHMNLLFRDSIIKYLSSELPTNYPELIEARLDYAAIFAIVCSSAILCCNIRVTAAISIIMIAVCALTASSTIFVGFYHTNSKNWITCGFFKDGLNGVIGGGAVFLCAYSGVETLSYVLEETHNPRKRMPFVVPLITFTFTLIMFLTTIIFTLTDDASTYSGSQMLVPSVFDRVNVPSARYVMTVGSVCGFSGAMLGVFLAPTRLLSSISADGLLTKSFFARTSRKRGIPYFAVLFVALISSTMIIFKQSVIIDIVALNTSIRCLLLACLVYDHHYRPDIIGLGREIAPYHKIKRCRYKRISADNDDQQSLTSSVNRLTIDSDENNEFFDDTNSSEYNSSFEYLRSILAIQHGVRRQDSQHRNMKLLHTNNNIDTLRATNWTGKHCSLSSNKLARSISRLNMLKNSYSLSENLKTIVLYCDDKRYQSLHSIDSRSITHQCLGSPCSPQQFDSNLSPLVGNQTHHLFDAEIPELPYCKKFSTTDLCSLDYGEQQHRRSIKNLIIFVVFAFVFSILILKIKNKHYWLSLTSIALAIVACAAIAIIRQAIDRRNPEINGKTPAFPYLTLITIVLSALLICSSGSMAFYKLIVWTIFGCLIYVLYGYSHSKHHANVLNSLITTSNSHVPINESYTQIGYN